MKQKIIFFKTTLCLALFLSISSAGFAQRTCDALMSDGKELFNSGKYADAIKIFEIAKQNNCNDAQSWINKCEKKIKSTTNTTSTVQQPQPQLSVEQTEYTFSSKSHDKYISVDANVDWGVTTANSGSWFNVRKDGNSVFVQLDENKIAKERKISFTLNTKAKSNNKSLTVYITQEGAEPDIKLSKNNINDVPVEGGSYLITVSTNAGEWKMSFPNDTSSWCKPKKENSKLRIVCDPNPTKYERSFSFDITAGEETSCTILVKQNGISLTIDEYILVFTEAGDNEGKKIKINSNTDWNIDDKDKKDFVIEKDNESITVSVSANEKTEVRKGSVIIKVGDVEKIIKFSQDAKNVELELLINELKVTINDTIIFSSSGKLKSANNEVKIKTNNTNKSPWEVASKPTWCNIEEGLKSIIVTVDKNKKRDDREGEIKIQAGDKFASISVKQSEKESWFRVKDHYHTVGFSFGYTEKYLEHSNDLSRWGIFEQNKYVRGGQVGLRIDPYFAPKIFGLGLHTGLYYKFFFQKSLPYSSSYNGDLHYFYEEHVLSVPLHLNYRIDFDNRGIFGIFFHGGINADVGLVSTIRDEAYSQKQNLYKQTSDRFDLAWGYGAGIHLHRFLFEWNGYTGILNHSKNPNYTMKQNSYMTFTLTIMFNKK